MKSRLVRLIVIGMLAPALLGAVTMPCALAEENATDASDAPALTLGDVNGDGVLTAADAAALLRGVDGALTLADETVEMADLTQSGAVDQTDVTASLWVAAGLIPDTVKFMERVSTGMNAENLFTEFRYDGVTDDAQGNYKSPSVSVTTTRHEAYHSVYYIADIYVQDIDCLATAFSGGRYRGKSQSVETMAANNDAVIAINGDYYTAQKLSPVIRNGRVYKDGVNSERDVGILTYEGELLTYKLLAFTREELATRNIYQSWVFGPVLLDENSNAMTVFNSRVGYANPRAAIGCYAPGHYCFILADGRQSDYSVGLSLEELSQICADLGLKSAYNLDGGQSAAMATRSGLVSQPYEGGRTISDIVYVRDVEA